MKKIIILMTLLLLPVLLLAQTHNWQWAINAGGNVNDEGYAITMDDEGNSYVTGYFYLTATFGSYSLTSSGYMDIFVAKISTNGNWEWAIQPGESNAAEGYAITIDNAGNSYVTGWFSGTATFGSYSISSSGGKDIFVAKIDTNGNWQWATQAGGTWTDEGFGITMDEAGNSYVTGCFSETANFGSYSITSSGDMDIFVAKIDTNGNWQWATQAGGNSTDYAKAITVDDAGNSYVTGWLYETATFGSYSLTGEGSFVAKIDTNGNWLWATHAGGSQGHAITIDNAGNSYTTGLVIIGNADIFVSKIDTNGNCLWATYAGGNSSDQGRGIAMDEAGNSYVTGWFSETATFGSYSITSSWDKDVFVAKIDTIGNWQWATQAGGIGDDLGYAITIDDSENSYVTGGFFETSAFGTHDLTSNGYIDIFIAKIEGDFIADFIVDTNFGFFPLNVNFTEISQGNIIEWQWDFENDGTVDSYEQNPMWTYTSQGVYSVSLTISDGDSIDTETKIDYITVINADPVVQNPLGTLMMYEDIVDSTSINLNNVFYDPNGDELSFSYYGNYHISVEIEADGRVILTPEENWFGDEMIYFTADDMWETDCHRSRNNSDKKLTKKDIHQEFSENSKSHKNSDNRAVVTDSLSVTVTPVNDPPWFTSIPDTTAIEDEIYQYIATADDIENDLLTFAAPVLPCWLTFTPAIGLLTGIPTNGDVGDHDVTITVTDGIIPVPIEQSFVIHVANINNPPEITFPAYFSFPEDESSTYDFTQYVTDIDNSYEELILTWEGNINIDIEFDNWNVTFSSNIENWFGEEVITFYVDDGESRIRSSSHHKSAIPEIKQDKRIKRINKKINDVLDEDRDIVSDSITVYCLSVNDPPVLLDWLPEELEFTIFEDSTITFMVQVEDVDSELNYSWFINEILLEDETDSIFISTFDEIGDFEIESIVSDEENQVEQNWLVHVNEIVGADVIIIPDVTRLYRNYPNPFNPTTTIRFDIKENETGNLSIFNLKGQIIETQMFNSGKHNYSWNAKGYSSGIYFYKLKAGDYQKVKKMLLLQ